MLNSLIFGSFPFPSVQKLVDSSSKEQNRITSCSTMYNSNMQKDSVRYHFNVDRTYIHDPNLSKLLGSGSWENCRKKRKDIIITEKHSGKLFTATEQPVVVITFKKARDSAPRTIHYSGTAPSIAPIVDKFLGFCIRVLRLIVDANALLHALCQAARPTGA